MDEGQITCYCLVTHPSQPLILVREDDGGYQCPAVSLPPRRLKFFPDYVPVINRGLRRELGLEVTVLRHLLDFGDDQVCLMEVHAECGDLPDGYVWLEAGEKTQWAGEASLRAWQAWNSLPGTDCSALAPWEQKGWFRAAALWTQERLTEAGYSLIGPVVQVKGAWSWSSLLRTETDQGAVYFKADYSHPPEEVSVILKLAKQWPRNVPQLIAADAGRNWMLMPDFGGESLESLGTGDFVSAVSQFAQIQRSTAREMPTWKSLGCPDRTATALMGLTDLLFADTGILCGGEHGLSQAELAALKRKKPLIAQLLTSLASSALPDTISSEDFKAGNVAVRDGQFLFYDWSGTVITHPFFGINYFLNRMVRKNSEDRFLWRADLQDAPRRAIVRAFLSEWAEYASWEQRVAEFWVCRRLSPLYEAVRCYNDLAFIGTSSPWSAGTLANIPNSLRQFLAALEYQPINLMINTTIAETLYFPFRLVSPAPGVERWAAGLLRLDPISTPAVEFAAVPADFAPAFAAAVGRGVLRSAEVNGLVGVCITLLRLETDPIDSKPSDYEMAGFQAIQAAIAAHGVPVSG